MAAKSLIPILHHGEIFCEDGANAEVHTKAQYFQTHSFVHLNISQMNSMTIRWKSLFTANKKYKVSNLKRE